MSFTFQRRKIENFLGITMNFLFDLLLNAGRVPAYFTCIKFEQQTESFTI